MLAVITGASRGIGESYARQLAARGYALLLASRDAERLARVAGEIRAAHAVAVEEIVLDLAQADGARDPPGQQCWVWPVRGIRGHADAAHSGDACSASAHGHQTGPPLPPGDAGAPQGRHYQRRVGRRLAAATLSLPVCRDEGLHGELGGRPGPGGAKVRGVDPDLLPWPDRHRLSCDSRRQILLGARRPANGG